jgi:hypothetical protein
MSYDNLSSVSQNVLKFYQQLTSEERKIPFIFDDFHFGKNPIFRHIKSNNSGTAKVKIIKTERDPPLFTSKQLIKFQKILRNTTQVIVLTGEERKIPFIFEHFHFCRSRVIGLDMTENRIFTLCRMIT